MLFTVQTSDIFLIKLYCHEGFKQLRLSN